jgi:hypothetical protein
MTFEQPPRLKHDQELGPILRAGDQVHVRADRLAKNAGGVKTAITTGATTGLWKVFPPLGLIAVGALITSLVSSGEPRSPQTTATPRFVAADARITEIPDSAATVLQTVDVEPPPQMVDVQPRPQRPRQPREHARSPIGIAATGEAAPTNTRSAATQPSDLPEQIELYEAARDASKRGEFLRCIELLDRLLQRFPTTPLRADVDLTRAEALARANRISEAVGAVEQLVRDAAHRGRRGELLRMLGDLYRQRHDCSHALDAYDKALSEPLSDDHRANVIRSRDKCR